MTDSPSPRAEHFNELTPAEAERLAFLIEECGEVIQAAAKILRHGYESYDPTDNSKGTNRDMLGRELGNVDAVISLLQRGGDYQSKRLTEGARAKLRSLQHYAHHQPKEWLKLP